MLNIISIADVAEQGCSEPYHCKAENHCEYFVKGLRSRRHSQINEWICAKIAEALKLPIAPFALLNVCEDLFEELPDPHKKIGMGAAFGSQALRDQVNVLPVHLTHIPIDLQRKIAAFDWLIGNMDRTAGNPNLLFQPSNKILTMIDHNLAFDPDFQADKFMQQHIFKEAFADCLHDIDHQDKITDWLLSAVPAFQAACQTLPPEWFWQNPENDLPTNYPFDYAKKMIDRLPYGALWR